MLWSKEVSALSVTVDVHRSHGPGRLAERRSVGKRTRRAGIALFFASVAVNAAIGIYAVLAPSFGETQGKILGTSLCVTGAVLLTLATEPAWERALLGRLPPAAAILGVLGFILAIAGIWTEPANEIWGKVTMTIFTISIAGVIASLLALAALSPRHAWLAKATYALLAVGAALYSVLPWFGDEPGEWFMRSLGVVMIAFAAFAVTVPVLHWIDRGAIAAVDVATGVIRFCPYCGRGLEDGTRAPLVCARCGREFTISSPPVQATRGST